MLGPLLAVTSELLPRERLQGLVWTRSDRSQSSSERPGFPWISPNRGWNAGVGSGQRFGLRDVFVSVRTGQGLHKELGFWDFLMLHSVIWEIPAAIPAVSLEFGGKIQLEWKIPAEIHPK